MRLLAPLITFIFFVLLEKSSGRQLTASSAFTILSLIGMLEEPIGNLLRTIPNLHSALSCFKRIESYLESDSRQLHILPLKTPPTQPSSGRNLVSTNDGLVKANGNIELVDLSSQGDNSSDVVIDVRNASFAWSRTGLPQINDVSFAVQRKSFVFIIGTFTMLACDVLHFLRLCWRTTFF
jgi:ATP-binding cassette subfamily C (CFTR/MRP) protein 1